MASRIDLPLDQLVGRPSGQFRRGGNQGVGGFKGGANNRGRGRGRGRGGGITTQSLRAAAAQQQQKQQQQNGGPSLDTKGKLNDLRDLIILKTKPAVTDLRSKLPPKQNNKSKKRGGGVPAKTAANTWRTAGSSGGVTTRTSKQSNVFYEDMAAGSTMRLPTAAEAKKITVTVQGLNKTTSEVYRKEERLAAVISRQRETRQQNFMKSREEFIASTITSALNGSRINEHIPPMRTNPPPYIPQRQYRSPTPIEYRQSYELRPPMSSPPMGSRQQRSLTTVTTLVISNLNDTVSHSDVYELCSAIGPLESVTLVAPGVAEVTYRYKDDALEAFKKYNQRNLDGMPMMCRLQSGGRPRAISVGGYGGRMSDPYQQEPMYGGPPHSVGGLY